MNTGWLGVPILPRTPGLALLTCDGRQGACTGLLDIIHGPVPWLLVTDKV